MTSTAAPPARSVVSQPPGGQTLDRGFVRRNEAAVVVVAALVAAVPLAFSRYFPGLDIPWHAAIIEVFHQHDAAAVDREFLGYFVVKPQVSSYLALYYLVDGLAFVVGDVVNALRLVLALYVVAFVWSVRALLRAYDGDGLYALAAIPAAYSITLEYGFITYALTFPITLASWALARRLMNDGIRPARAIAFGVLALAISFTHPFAAVVSLVGTGIVALTHLGAVPRAGRRLAWVAVLVVAGIVPAIVAVVSISQDATTAIATKDHYGGMLTQLLEMDRTPVVESMALIPLWLFGFLSTELRYALFGALLIGVVVGRHRARPLFTDASDRGPAMMLVVLTVAYLLTPFVFVWPRDWFAAQPRLVPLLFVVLLVVLRSRPHGRAALGPAIVATLAAAALLAISFQTFLPHGVEGRDFEKVAAMGKARARTLSLIEMPRTELRRPASPWRHAGAWFFVENHGFVSGLPMSETGTLSAGGLVPVGPATGAPWTPSGPPLGYSRTFRWEIHGPGWDQFLIRDTDPVHPFDYFREYADRVELVARSGRWRLYRAIHRDLPSSAAK